MISLISLISLIKVNKVGSNYDLANCALINLS